MTTRAICPKCEKALRIKPELAGKRIRCPQCQHAFAVGAMDAPAIESAEASPPIPLAAGSVPSQGASAAVSITSTNAADTGSTTRTTALLLLFLVGAAALFYGTWFVLHWHWFWAASFSLLMSSWVAWGLIVLLWEGDYASRRIGQWISSETPVEKIATELPGTDGDLIVPAMGMWIALSIAAFYLVPWAPASVLGSIGFGSLCLFAPLVVFGCYLAAVEKGLGKREDRVLAAFRESHPEMYQQIIEARETRKREAEAARQQAAVAKRTQQAMAGGPEAFGKMLSTMNAEEIEALAKNLSENPVPGLDRYRQLMEPVMGEERMEILVNHASADFWRMVSKMSDEGIAQLAETCKKNPSLERLQEGVAGYREPQPAAMSTTDKLSQAAVWARFGYYVGRIVLGG